MSESHYLSSYRQLCANTSDSVKAVETSPEIIPSLVSCDKCKCFSFYGSPQRILPAVFYLCACLSVCVSVCLCPCLSVCLSVYFTVFYWLTILLIWFIITCYIYLLFIVYYYYFLCWNAQKHKNHLIWSSLCFSCFLFVDTSAYISR